MITTDNLYETTKIVLNDSLLEKMMNTKSQNILLVKRYQKYFRNFLGSLEKMKYLCDL
mgnify:CR=1 FL=1